MNPASANGSPVRGLVMIKRTHFLFFSFFALFFLGAAFTAFGLGGDSNSEKTLPLPAKNFSVIVTDSKEVTTNASRVSWDGKIYIQGRRGDALTTIPFEKIQRITLSMDAKTSLGNISAIVELRSGQKVNLDLAGNTKCYGETDFGQFEIYIKDIKSIEFQ